MCPRINDTAFTPPRGFHYGTYSQQTNRHHPHLYKPGTTPCGLPRFPCPSAPPPDPYGPVLRGLPGRGRPSGGRAPGPDGIRRLAPGPVVMESPPPIPPHARGPRPDHRIRIPSVRRSGRGSTDTNEYGEGREEGGEGTDGCPNGYERGNTSERRRMRRE